MSGQGERPAETRRTDEGSLAQRADALASRRRILDAASALMGDGRASMAQIAAAADVGRSTLYRHFPTREALIEALDQLSPAMPRDTSDGRDGPVPGRPSRPALRDRQGALELASILDDVPPHAVADQLVAEARRVARAAAALYVVDIDGTRMYRLAGTDELPAELSAPPALGPDIVPEALPGFTARLQELLPRCTAHPLWHRGRIVGLLLVVGTPSGALSDVLRQGALALEAAMRCTDQIHQARRRAPTTAIAELQLELLPPRIAQLMGAQIAGFLLPSYDVGGDWFDFAENRDGAWLALADIAGVGGPAKGSYAAAAVSALRAARRSGLGLADAAGRIDAMLRSLDDPEYRLATVLAHWHPPSGIFSWLRCGDAAAYRIDADGDVSELAGDSGPALGEGARHRLQVNETRLESGDRVMLASNGVVGRETERGGPFGIEGMRRAIVALGAPTAAATALAIQQALTATWAAAEDDDATLVVLSID